MMQLMDGISTASMAFYSTMDEAFAYIYNHAKQGDVVLLSPAASSYDLYKNFEERGAKFKQLAQQFGQ